MADKLNCWKTDPIKVKSEILKKKKKKSKFFYDTEINKVCPSSVWQKFGQIISDMIKRNMQV